MPRVEIGSGLRRGTLPRARSALRSARGGVVSARTKRVAARPTVRTVVSNSPPTGVATDDRRVAARGGLFGPRALLAADADRLGALLARDEEGFFVAVVDFFDVARDGFDVRDGFVARAFTDEPRARLPAFAVEREEVERAVLLRAFDAGFRAVARVLPPRLAAADFVLLALAPPVFALRRAGAAFVPPRFVDFLLAFFPFGGRAICISFTLQQVGSRLEPAHRTGRTRRAAVV
jgi:hypothetical protein